MTRWEAIPPATRRIASTPHTFRESVDLLRIGRDEVDANPDGIALFGPMFETLGTLGLLSREASLDPASMTFRSTLNATLANANSGMGYVWLVTQGNRRADQLAAGADWLRLNLALTAEGLSVQPMSQALQEFPEMAVLYDAAHAALAPQGGTVQMLGRIGYAGAVPPAPRWPLETRILNA